MDEKQFVDMWNVMKQHDLVLVDETRRDFNCIICKKIVINACTAPCGCRFCADCIEQYLQNDKRKCPGQTECCEIEEIDFNSDIHVNRVLNKRISKLSVKCPNVGCQSQVEMNMISNHLRTCGNQPTSCPYLKIGCEDVKFRNDEMSQHLLVEIHPHSKLLINWIINSQNETKSIKSDIEKLTTMIESLSKDNEDLKMQRNLDKERTEKVIREMLEMEKENSTEMNDKLKSEVKRLTKENEELKAKTTTDKENIEKSVRVLFMKEKENSTEIQRLNEEMCALKNSNRSIKEKLAKFKIKNGEQVSKLNAAVENQIKEIEELKNRWDPVKSHKSPEKSHEVYTKVNKIPQQCDSLKTETMESAKSIENIRRIIDETISGEFHFTIDKWNEKLKNAQNGKEIYIFSDSVFTHKKGFNFCLVLWPSSSYAIRIDFHIKKGPFDDSLRWPFDRDLELSLMNPQNGLAFKTVTTRTSTITDNFKTSLSKPKTEMNGSIYLFGIPLVDLSNNPELTNNDKISIKLSIKAPSFDIKIK